MCIRMYNTAQDQNANLYGSNKTFRREKANNEQKRKDREKHGHFRGGLEKKLFANIKHRPEEDAIILNPDPED